MPASRFRAVLVAPALFAVLCSRAAADTWVVDSTGSVPGAQFTDIPPAIAAAHSGDVILVLSGTYSPFSLDKGLTIIGYDTPIVPGTVSIVNVSRGLVAAVVALSLDDVVIDHCRGAVILQDVPALKTLRIRRATDVRLSRVVVTAPLGTPFPFPITAATAAAARVELVQSSLRGNSGPQTICSCNNHGGSGLDCTFAARVHVARTDCHGGDGGPGAGQGSYGGSGGQGIAVQSGSVVIVAGGDQSDISGGSGGTGGCCTGCFFYGAAGAGIANWGGVVSWSGASIHGPDWYSSPNCTLHPGIAIGGPSSQSVPDDPTLVASGTASPGHVLSITLRGPVGATANLNVGLSAIVVPDSLAAIERLTPPTRIFPLGTIPASGEIAFNTVIPPNLDPGFFFVAQAEVTLSGTGEMRRTNSVPIVVR